MNTNQVIGLTVAASAIVLGACFWFMSKDDEPFVSATDAIKRDGLHFDYVTDQWHKAKEAVVAGEVDVIDQDSFYKQLHRQLEVYITDAVFTLEGSREDLHAKNAMFLSEVV